MEKIKKEQISNENDSYKKKIYENLKKINNTWILNQILIFIENITKDCAGGRYK